MIEKKRTGTEQKTKVVALKAMRSSRLSLFAFFSLRYKPCWESRFLRDPKDSTVSLSPVILLYCFCSCGEWASVFVNPASFLIGRSVDFSESLNCLENTSPVTVHTTLITSLVLSFPSTKPQAKEYLHLVGWDWVLLLVTGDPVHKRRRPEPLLSFLCKCWQPKTIERWWVTSWLYAFSIHAV